MIEITATSLRIMSDGTPELETTLGYTFVPQEIAIALTWEPLTRGWSLDDVSARGVRRKADGELSARRGARAWHDLSSSPSPHDGMPAWLVALCDAAVTEASEAISPAAALDPAEHTTSA